MKVTVKTGLADTTEVKAFILIIKQYFGYSPGPITVTADISETNDVNAPDVWVEFQEKVSNGRLEDLQVISGFESFNRHKRLTYIVSCKE